MKRIVISNASGGEGKTTLTAEIAHTLAAQGHRVAVIDTDPQGSLSERFGIRHQGQSVAHVFSADDHPTLPAPVHVQGLDLWPADDHLLRVPQMIGTDFYKQGFLREACDRLDHDFLLIDTPPGVSVLLNAALAAADFMVVPVASHKGLQNLGHVARLLKSARMFAPELRLSLLVPSRYDAQTNLSRGLLEALQDYATLAPIAHPVRESVKIGEAAVLGRPLIRYRSTADVTGDIREVTRQLIEVTR